jgi:hypothetical protein
MSLQSAVGQFFIAHSLGGVDVVTMPTMPPTSESAASFVYEQTAALGTSRNWYE